MAAAVALRATQTLAACCSSHLSAAAAPALAARCLSTSAAADGKVKVAVRAEAPPGWKWGADQRANGAAYNAQRLAWREELAQRRREWQKFVVAHEKKLDVMKQHRDEVRLKAQNKALQRQFDRWKIPTHLRTSQERRSDPVERRAKYARHALRQSLGQMSRAVQTQKLLNESGGWIAPDKIDDAVSAALDSPEPLYTDCWPWDGDDEGVPHFVEGFEGPELRPRRVPLPETDSDDEVPHWHRRG